LTFKNVKSNVHRIFQPNKPPPAKKAFLSSASASNENMASTKPLVMTVDMPLKKKKSMGKCRLWTRGSSIKKFKKKANAAAAVIAVAKAGKNILF
jgi:hypothetical protein